MSSSGFAAAGAGFLAAGREVSGSENGLGIPPAQATGTAKAACRRMKQSKRRGERMGS